ncbi:aminoglycoside phosphotransferase family protein [Pseudomonas carassii]|uniref:Aminoglycoside phosphotransferase family protein n=1 Tax=Pseudomonas carassii TaxID=3115855 RepID=A0ABU7HDX9_9PSED|nr:aminoglycoside phosphotransferase family protein [Pseudomonas sp. 137P]MEE1889522.1 aminoglycoside phosphotransferase family protein [Pseudomonas sp. 137P]
MVRRSACAPWQPGRFKRVGTGGFARRIAIISAVAGIDARRFLQWVLAWAGLLATWMIEDGIEPDSRLEMAKQAALALNGGALVH